MKKEVNRKKQAYRKTTLFFSLVCVAASFYLYQSLSHYHQGDIEAYKKLYDPAEEESTIGSIFTLATRCAWICGGEEEIGSISRQDRRGLQKDLFYHTANNVMRFRVTSEQALLAFERHNGMLNAIEHMKNAVFMLQQDLLWMLPDGRYASSLEGLLHFPGVEWADLGHALPVQQVVRVYTDKATHHYESDLFDGEGVKMEYVLLPGHEFDEKLPVMPLNPNGYTITATYALFRREATDQSLPVKGIMQDFPGRLILGSRPPQERCLLTSSIGDRIVCDEITIDATTNKMTMENPTGLIARYDNANPVAFQSQRLIWDDQQNTLNFLKDVSISQGVIGSIQTSEGLLLTTAKEGEKQKIKTIVTKGDTTLVFEDEGETHTLTTKGLLKIDNDKMEARIFGLADADGIVFDGGQVFFKDSKGEIFADRALVKYAMIDNKPVEKKLVLLGDVKIINRLPSTSSPLVPVLQHILADRVDYLPETKEMLFSADKGKRVLLFDKTNNFQVSAPSVKITRDRAASKETIQGIGDVRFRLLKSEYEEIKKRFSLDTYYKNRSSSHDTK